MTMKNKILNTTTISLAFLGFLILIGEEAPDVNIPIGEFITIKMYGALLFLGSIYAHRSINAHIARRGKYTKK